MKTLRPRLRRSPEEEAIRLRLKGSLAIVLFACCVGVGGFYLLWSPEGTLLDAIYMTFLTLTTIGFEEVRPLGTGGRWLTMATALLGIGGLFSALGTGLEYFFWQSRGAWGSRRMQKQVDALEGHVIVAGLGRMGRQAVRELQEGGTSLVVIDPSDAALDFARERELPFIKGDSSSDEALVKANIARASGLIVTTDSDATNMYVVLSARLLNPKLRIVSRAVEEASVAKLLRAGADRALNPYAIGGRRLAHLLSSPTVVDFFETALTRGDSTLSIEDLEVPSALAGKTLSHVRDAALGVNILVVLRKGTPLINPKGELALEAGDRVLAFGTKEQLEAIQASFRR
jgi:voltage-gated potassium channel